MIQYERVEMRQPPIPSSQIVSIGYSPTDRCLYVEFKGTGVYRYHDLMPGVYANILKAKSIGKFIAKEVVPNHGSEKVFEAVNLTVVNDVVNRAYDKLVPPPENII